MHSEFTIHRRAFIQQSAVYLAAIALPFKLKAMEAIHTMKHYDTIIIGGSYSGLAAAMALGRALKTVLVIDNGNPSNKQTPYSHNFLTQDGIPPFAIAAQAKDQVKKYSSVSFLNDTAISSVKTPDGFETGTLTGEKFSSKKLIFSSGIRDILPSIYGISECWGISVLHCPYCHGYEVKNQATGIIGNGDAGFELAKLISNWTPELSIFTNGPSTLSTAQCEILAKHKIKIIDSSIVQLHHEFGSVNSIQFTNRESVNVNAVYIKVPFEQHCNIPMTLGCELDEDGYILTNASQETNVSGVYACGDNSSRMRTVANAVGTGTTAGMSASKSIILNTY